MFQFGNTGMRAQKEGVKQLGRTAEFILTRVNANPIILV